MSRRTLRTAVFFLLIPLFPVAGRSQTPGETVAERIPPPPGFTRVEVPAGSFGAWLRRLPLRPGRPQVRLFDGQLKRNQQAHHAVVDLDVGHRDLQQCADAVIRLMAEYLWDAGCRDQVAFEFTSGDLARWRDWRQGLRPQVSANRVRWRSGAAQDASHANFRRYLDTVFTYAGTASLAQEMAAVADPSRVEAGDVFIQPGFPGHAVLVVDVVEHANGERRFLLLQSYMPAQDVHVLRNPRQVEGDPWYPARPTGELLTPEWRFRYQDLRRLKRLGDCRPAL